MDWRKRKKINVNNIDVKRVDHFPELNILGGQRLSTKAYDGAK